MISLAQALKVKNKLAGEIASTQVLFTTKNSFKEGIPNNYDLNVLHTELLAKVEKLVELKTKIFAANAGIAEPMSRLAETKGMIAFLKGVPTNEGVVKEFGGFRSEPVEIKYIVWFNDKSITDMISKLEIDVFNLQEVIDAYNHNTKIDFKL